MKYYKIVDSSKYKEGLSNGNPSIRFYDENSLFKFPEQGDSIAEVEIPDNVIVIHRTGTYACTKVELKNIRLINLKNIKLLELNGVNIKDNALNVLLLAIENKAIYLIKHCIEKFRIVLDEELSSKLFDLAISSGDLDLAEYLFGLGADIFYSNKPVIAAVDFLINNIGHISLIKRFDYYRFILKYAYYSPNINSDGAFYADIKYIADHSTKLSIKNIIKYLGQAMDYIVENDMNEYTECFGENKIRYLAQVDKIGRN